MHTEEDTAAVPGSIANTIKLDENLNGRNHLIRDQDGSDLCAGAARQWNGLKTELIQDMSQRQERKNWYWLWKAWIQSPTDDFSFSYN